LCEAAIIDYDSWQLAEGGSLSLPGDHTRYASHPAGAERYHCDTKVLLPSVVYSIEMALPVRSDLQRLLSWLITSTKDMGWWRAEDNAARQRFIPMASCSDTTTSSSAESLDFNSGAGVIFLSLGCTAAGLLMNALIRCSPAERAARRQYARKEAVYKEASASQNEQRRSLVKEVSRRSSMRRSSMDNVTSGLLAAPCSSLDMLKNCSAPALNTANSALNIARNTASTTKSWYGAQPPSFESSPRAISEPSSHADEVSDDGFDTTENQAEVATASIITVAPNSAPLVSDSVRELEQMRLMLKTMQEQIAETSLAQQALHENMQEKLERQSSASSSRRRSERRRSSKAAQNNIKSAESMAGDAVSQAVVQSDADNKSRHVLELMSSPSAFM